MRFKGGDLVMVDYNARDRHESIYGIVVKQQKARCFHIIENKGDCNREIVEVYTNNNKTEIFELDELVLLTDFK